MSNLLILCSYYTTVTNRRRRCDEENENGKLKIIEKIKYQDRQGMVLYIGT